MPYIPQNQNWSYTPSTTVPYGGWTPQGPTWQQYPSYSRYVPKPQQVLTVNNVSTVVKKG